MSYSSMPLETKTGAATWRLSLVALEAEDKTLPSEEVSLKVVSVLWLAVTSASVVMLNVGWSHS